MQVICVNTLLLACQSPQHRALEGAPSWFIDRSIEAVDKQTLGYGYGMTYEEATSSAVADIANQLGVKVTSSLTHTVSTGSAPRSESHHSLSATTDLTLENLAELKKEITAQGIYLLYAYRSSSLIQAINSLLEGTTCANAKFIGRSNYLQYTLPFQAIKNQLGCLPAFRFGFRSHRWYVQYQDKFAPITSEDLKQFYVSYQNPAVELQLTNKVVEHLGFYQVLIEAQKAGFLNLFQIGADGNSQLLLNNRPVAANTKVDYPDKHRFHGLQALSSNRNVASNDLLVAALCPEAIYLPPIAAIHHQLVNADTRQFLPQLFEQTEHCAISTQLLTILPMR